MQRPKQPLPPFRAASHGCHETGATGAASCNFNPEHSLPIARVIAPTHAQHQSNVAQVNPKVKVKCTQERSATHAWTSHCMSHRKAGVRAGGGGGRGWGRKRRRRRRRRRSSTLHIAISCSYTPSSFISFATKSNSNQIQIK